MGGRTAALAALGCAGCALYVLPLVVPPAGGDLDAGLVGRLFPGVPGWWIVGRLIALVIGVVCAEQLAWERLGKVPALTESPRANTGTPVAAAYVWAAFLLAAAQAVVGVGAPYFGRAMQLLYVAAFAVPPLLLAWGREGGTAHRPHMNPGRAAVAVVAVIAVWLALRVPDALHSPRMANAVDTWWGFRYLEATGAPGFNLLTDGFLPGVTALHMTLQGAGVVGEGGIPLRMEWVQALHFGWLVVAAAIVAWLAACLVGRGAALVATATFLCAPFVLLLPLQPSAFIIGPVSGAVLLALLVRLRTCGSLSALAALGAVAGVSATHPSLMPVALLSGVLAAREAWRLSGVPRLALAIPLMAFAAGVIPAVGRQLDGLTLMRERYVGREGQWAGLEEMLFGQRSPKDVDVLWAGTSRGPLDTPLGALLAPFAVARTPARLWGDVVFEPIGTVCATLAIVVCMRRLRGRWTAQVLLLMLGAGLIPGLLSSYDRTSVTRLFVAPVPIAVLAAVGFETVRAAWARGSEWGVAALCSVAIAAGGIVLFDVVNPRLLSASSVGITLEALDGEWPQAGVVLLDHPPYDPRRGDWLQVRTLATHVPRRPVPVVTYNGAGDLQSIGARAALVFWSPALEADAHVMTALCDHWPNAVLYTLHDRAARSYALAADLTSSQWRPALPAGRWTTQPCNAGQTRTGASSFLLGGRRLTTARGSALRVDGPLWLS